MYNAADHRWQTCKIVQCKDCQDNVDDGYVMACDGCGEPGHAADADGWVIAKAKNFDGETNQQQQAV